MNWYYLWWIPATIIFYIFYSWLSVKWNTTGDIKWAVFLILTGLLPVWLIVSKISTNITLDGMIYDVVLFLGCAIGLGIFSGALFEFSIIQIIGFITVIVGFILMHIK